MNAFKRATRVPLRLRREVDPEDANREMRSGPNWGAASLLIAVVAGGYFLWTKKGSKNVKSDVVSTKTTPEDKGDLKSPGAQGEWGGTKIN
ncbi:hypothetical protein VTP01DRAFT_4078 [Rhizomucor pusillus]|uniref:uncharacterized protein n=1 Tax=Rhizomucor pusillus TaxID=4840 RepID=UPI0037446833